MASPTANGILRSLIGATHEATAETGEREISVICASALGSRAIMYSACAATTQTMQTVTTCVAGCTTTAHTTRNLHHRQRVRGLVG